MERRGTLDAAGAAQVIRFNKVLRVVVLLIATTFCLHDWAQTDPTFAAKQLFEQERWSELAQLLQQTPRNSADLDYYYGVAGGHRGRGEEALGALPEGQRWAPNDKGFPMELA